MPSSERIILQSIHVLALTTLFLLCALLLSGTNATSLEIAKTKICKELLEDSKTSSKTDLPLQNLSESELDKLTDERANPAMTSSLFRTFGDASFRVAKGI